jgi:hypothetical protein
MVIIVYFYFIFFTCIQQTEMFLYIFDIILKTYNIKSLEIHKTKENFPRAKLYP